MLDTKIDINIVSMHQNVLDRFWETYFPSIQGFTNLRTIVFHEHLNVPQEVISIPTQIKGTPWNTVFNQGIVMAKNCGAKVVGQLNDDIDFTDKWLVSCLPWLKTFPAISPGYVQQSKDVDFLHKAAQKTSGEDWVIRYLYGSCILMDVDKIDTSIFDERYTWGCIDFDLICELEKRGMYSATLKEISILHHGGVSHSINVDESKRWNAVSKKDTNSFYEKWGYREYRNLIQRYRRHHSYFRKIENDCK